MFDVGCWMFWSYEQNVFNGILLAFAKLTGMIHPITFAVLAVSLLHASHFQSLSLSGAESPKTCRHKFRPRLKSGLDVAA